MESLKQVNLPFQYLRVDNAQVRKMILEDTTLEIQTVPCVLVTYVNGMAEKFEGGEAFTWLEGILSSTRVRELVPEPVLKPIQEPVQTQPIQEPVQRETKRQKINRLPQTELPSIEELEEGENGGEIMVEEEDPEIPTERHIVPKQPKRIRNGERGFYEGDDLFSGEQTDNRREPSKVVKSKSSSVPEQDPHGTFSRAKEFEQARREIENQTSDMRRKPFESRSP